MCVCVDVGNITFGIRKRDILLYDGSGSGYKMSNM